MDQFLEGLRQEGYFDSEGRFTLDPRRARDLLRQFQLADPHHYVLHLVSFAFAEGAQRIQIEAGALRVALEAAGICLDRETVRNPLAGLFSRAAGRSRGELSIGINTALRLPESSLRLRSWDGQRGWSGHYEGDRFDLEEWEGEGDTPWVRIEVQRRAPLRPEELRRGPGGEVTLPFPEAEAVEEAFCLCPVPVEVNGRVVSRPIPLDGLALFLQAVPESPATRLCYEGEVQWSRQHGARFSALVQLGRQEGLGFLVLGRLYRRPSPWRLSGSDLGLSIVVASDRLERDLSHAQVVENTVYQNLLVLLREEVLGALAGFAAAPHKLGPRLVYRAYDLLEYLVEASARAGWLKEAYRLQHVLMEVAAGRNDRWRHSNALYRLALLTDRLAEPGAAQELRAQARLTAPVLGGGEHVAREGESVPASSYFQWCQARAAQAILGPGHPIALGELARAALAVEETCPRLAETCWRLVLEGRNGGPEMLTAWGRVLFRLGRPQEARAALERAHRVPGARPWEVEVELQEWTGLVAAELGHLAEANRLLASALELKRSRLGDYSVELGLTLQRLAALADATGQKANARHYRRWASMLKP